MNSIHLGNIFCGSLPAFWENHFWISFLRKLKQSKNSFILQIKNITNFLNIKIVLFYFAAVPIEYIKFL